MDKFVADFSTFFSPAWKISFKKVSAGRGPTRQLNNYVVSSYISKGTAFQGLPKKIVW